MQYITKTIAIFGLIASAGTVQARDWGFSKDTLSEWRPGGDSVMLANQGGFLRFDSIFMEVIRAPTLEHIDVAFRIPPAQYSPKRVLYFFKDSSGSYRLSTIQLPNASVSSVLYADSMQTILLRDFEIDSYVGTVPKSAASMAVGDTITARLIFSVASRGRDTVIMNGTYRGGGWSPIHPGNPKALRRTGSANPFFDPRGRRVEKRPEGLKVPWTPVISPKD